MTIAAATLATALDLLIIFIGARFFAVPLAAAAAFGVRSSVEFFGDSVDP